MPSNDGGQGGVGGLTVKFQQADLGDVEGSWVGGGQNQPVSGEQLIDVLAQTPKPSWLKSWVRVKVIQPVSYRTFCRA